MAAKGSFPMRVESNLYGFAIVLKSAACEWLLLFLLLLDGAFSFLLTKFAQYCELQLPCILCSRLGHVLGNEKPEFYRHLFCNDHRLEVSSLVMCQKHGKLADAHEMCKECLLSYVKKESSEEMYKFLVGKLGSDCLQKPFLSMDCGLSTRLCSCCTKPWRSRPNVHKLVQSRPSPPVSKPNIPSPKSPGRRCFNRQEGLKKRKDRFSEVKINSDSESQFPFSDDEDMIPFPRDLRRVKEGFLSQQGLKLSPRKHHDGDTNPRSIHKSSHIRSNLMHANPMLVKDDMYVPKHSASNGDPRHSFAESNWQQIRKKAAPALLEFTSLNDVSLSPRTPVSSPIVFADEGDKFYESNKSNAPEYPDLVFTDNALHSTELLRPSRLSRESRANETGVFTHKPVTSSWESIDLDSANPECLETDLFKQDDVLMPSSSTNDIQDLTFNVNKEVKFSEKHSRTNHNAIESMEEITSTPISSPIFANPSGSNKNLTANGHSDGHQMANDHNTMPSSMQSNSPSIQSLESLEPVGEIEGDTLIEKLKCQVEYYKKCMNNLHKELEEERNASAIAANQAMAMITKLQEEKAELNMEARHYLRLMDEQAEFDVDALEKANDLLAEREKEIQDLEAELDYFRLKYPDDFPEYLDMEDEIVDMDDTLTSNMANLDIEES